MEFNIGKGQTEAPAGKQTGASMLVAGDSAVLQVRNEGKSWTTVYASAEQENEQ